MGGVQVSDLLLPGVAVEVDQLVLTDTEVRLAVRSGAASAACPGCGRKSSRVHCYYQRMLTDRPVAGRHVRIELRARRLVCGHDRCARRTFAEQIPALTRRHARRTDALNAQLTDVALFLGGRPGARLSQRMTIDICKDTLLRLIRKLPLPSSGPVPHLGVDEFAFRRGRTYATILIDMATHRPVDVLADRAAATFASWLRDHPEVRIICRDRAGSYRDGAQAGAPQTRQVADAWHLLNNLAQAVERVIGRHRADLRQPLASHDDRTEDDPAPAGRDRAELDIHGRPRPLVARTRERHQQIHERIERGDSLRAIARDLELSRGTVNRFARAAEVDELLIAAIHRPTLIDDYRLYLHHRWMEGCTNASALTREIQRLGYRGDINTVRQHLKPYRDGAIPATAPSPHLTVRRVTDWIMRRPEHLTDLEQKGLDELCERNPALATTVEYARRLALMIRERRSEHLALDVWIADVRLDGQRELRTLANGMRRDHAAIQAALTTTYTSGAVEGNVTRIKLLKRQMYGRANFDLLRRRILLSP
ncbi:ISL3 family transposase [Streptomyces virginiae]|uniref:ISL3 family transposase n=1 Tax=Streptomyces virginiae TaxID=1961 RepID=UPI0022560F0F|nr:ISL3 family transposase [Streptomyces virginiae]MCX5174321.1 ISL3 family transposase [Streptomyces virginiae]